MHRFSRRIREELNIWCVGALPGFAVIAAITVARMLGGLQPLELIAFDGLMRSRPNETTDDRVVVIGIDDEDIAELKTYPVPDRELANLITKLQAYQPAAIGLDLFRDLPIEPGHQELIKTFQTYSNSFVVDQLPFGGGIAIPSPKGISLDQVGFANSLPLDLDGQVRRHLLGATDPRHLNSSQSTEHYRFALDTQLATKFLETQGYTAQAGQRDSETLAFGSVEFPRVQKNTGAYISVDFSGTQILINYRNGDTPFRVLPLRDIRRNQFQPDWIRGKVVLIGVTAIAAKDFASAPISVPNSKNYPGYPGVKIHAHVVSQILAAVLDQRPLLKSWNDTVEYMWIIAWGILGIAVGRRFRAPWQILPTVVIAILGLTGICYGLLLVGWWVPIVPAAIVFILNGAGVASMLIRQQEVELRKLYLISAIRQTNLERVFNSIHNGPLQRIAVIRRLSQEQELPQQQILSELDYVDQELRNIRRYLERERSEQSHSLYLGGSDIDLQLPLHEILFAVYEASLTSVEQFPGFQTIKVKIVDFMPMNDEKLTLKQKENLCRFLEEALNNVAKHAINPTKLWVFCGQEAQRQVIRVTDNGSTFSSSRVGLGTEAARILAKQLGGTFCRRHNSPQGTICELTWSTYKFSL